jgi:hypothetical protein
VSNTATARWSSGGGADGSTSVAVLAMSTDGRGEDILVGRRGLSGVHLPPASDLSPPPMRRRNATVPPGTEPSVPAEEAPRVAAATFLPVAEPASRLSGVILY